MAENLVFLGMSRQERIAGVPTNIITGFLGSGKTTAILHLLRSRPRNERWAVLVNEFGEIGVDGSLFKGKHSKEQGVFIQEVPGGCMCCAAGLPMQVALNTLLSESNPSRLLIEPTGLGHPVEVLEVLRGEHYREVLKIDKVVTLVDARCLADRKYTEHETFQQQVAIADVIVGNKADLYGEGDSQLLKKYAEKHGVADAHLVTTEHGRLNLSILEGRTGAEAPLEHHHHHDHEHHHDHDHDHGHHTQDHDESATLASDLPIPQSGYLRVENAGEGFRSVGWRFDPQVVFNHDKLHAFLNTLSVQRIKGVFETQWGPYGYNYTGDGLNQSPLESITESRIEIIALSIDDTWERQLLNCAENLFEPV